MMSRNIVGFLPSREYKRIYGLVPNLCIDVLVVAGKEFLLCKRKNSPVQGQWFVPGGRVFKGETLARAATRKLREELGIKVAPGRLQFLTVIESFFQDSRFGGPIHNVAVAFTVKFPKRPKISLDTTESSRAEWFRTASPRWHREVRSIAKEAGFKSGKRLKSPA